MTSFSRALIVIVILVMQPAGSILAWEGAGAQTLGAVVPAPTARTGSEQDEEERSSVEPAKLDPAMADYWRAIKLLGSKSATEVKAGRAALMSAADLEYTHAQVLLGNCHLAGKGIRGHVGKGIRGHVGLHPISRTVVRGD